MNRSIRNHLDRVVEQLNKQLRADHRKMVEDAYRQVVGLGLQTPDEAAAIIREIRDGR